MKTNNPDLFVFVIDGQRFAIPLEQTEIVLAAAEVEKVPEAPEFMVGCLDLHGEILPVISLHKKFNLLPGPLRPDQHFILCRTPIRKIILIADSSEGVVSDYPMVDPEKIASFDETSFAGIVRDSQGLIFIFDLEKLINYREELQIAKLLS